jgi:hypothetical protein
MNPHFNEWVPTEIVSLMPDSRVNMTLELTACDCNGRWPNAEVSLGDYLIYCGPIIKSKIIVANVEVIDASTKLIIKIHSKTNDDTVTDEYGNILQNQSAHLRQLTLNDVDIVKNCVIKHKVIYKGVFQMSLDAEKMNFFNQNNISTEVIDYNFYENGTWTLPLDLPILTGLVRSIATTEAYEKIDYHSTMSDIINKINSFTKEKLNART